MSWSRDSRHSLVYVDDAARAVVRAIDLPLRNVAVNVVGEAGLHPATSTRPCCGCTARTPRTSSSRPDRRRYQLVDERAAPHLVRMPPRDEPGGRTAGDRQLAPRLRLTSSCSRRPDAAKSGLACRYGLTYSRRLRYWELVRRRVRNVNHSTGVLRQCPPGCSRAHDTVFIDGEWLPAATRDRIEVVSPWSEEVIASVPSGSREDMDRAVAAAQTSTLSPVRGLRCRSRSASEILTRLRDLLVAHTDEFAQLITDEMGCPITQSRAIQVGNPVGILEAYLDAAAEYPFRAVRRLQGRAGAGHERPCGRGRGRGPVERAALAHHAEACAGTAHRMHGRAQARARDSDGRVPRRAAPESRPGCLRASSTWFRRTARSAST